MKLKQLIIRHLQENKWQYFVIILIFLLGLLSGNYKVGDLDSGVKNYLLTLVDNYLQEGALGPIDNSTIFINAFLNQCKMIVVVWFLGLTVIGLPLILGVVFLKGLSLGFTVGFLVEEKALGGFLVGLLSIVPQNLVYIPFMLIWAVIAMNFSLNIIKGTHLTRANTSRSLISFTMMMGGFLIISFVGSLIEAYLSPYLLSLFLRFL